MPINAYVQSKNYVKMLADMRNGNLNQLTEEISSVLTYVSDGLVPIKNQSQFVQDEFIISDKEIKKS